MKKLLLIFIVFIVSIFPFHSYSTEITTLTDKFHEYTTYTNSKKIEDLVPLLKEETVWFSNFSPDDEIINFRYVVPDTFWIKQRPKKNPKEGKHYTLRHLYHSESYEDVYNNKIIKERTPASEFVDAQFTVNDVKRLSSSSYIISPNYEVYLTNIATGEEVIWSITNDYPFRGEYIVHLTGLSKKLNLNGQNIYSAEKVSNFYNTYDNISKYRCNDTDAIIYIKHEPQFQINITTINENDKESTFTLPIGTKNNSYSSNKTIWFDESQLADVIDSNKTYEIDYNIRLEFPEVEFPFNFAYILGGLDVSSSSVGQKIKPSKYSSYANDLSSDVYLYQSDISFLYIGDKISVRGEEFYKAVYAGRAFYIPVSKVKLSDEEKLKLDSLLSATPEVRDAFFELQKALSYTDYMDYVEGIANKIKAVSSKGISIYSMNAYDMSDYIDGTGIEFVFHNPTNKVIKYINIGFVGYNAVDDRVGSPISRRCIGPIEPDGLVSYEFDYAWFTDIVEYAKVTSLSVQYKDGTTKTISNPNSVVWTDDMIDGLSKLPVENLKYEVVNLDK